MKKSCAWLLMLLGTWLKAESPGWDFRAAYGLGYAEYAEEGNFYQVESDWSAPATLLMLEAMGTFRNSRPYLRMRFTGSAKEEERWKERGLLIQRNEMRMAALDLHAGVAFPRKAGAGELTPSLGLRWGNQIFERGGFTRFDGEPLWNVHASTVTEQVVTFGVGGGLSWEMPLRQSWLLGLDGSAYWIFYNIAENDGFNSRIEGQGGVMGEAALSLARNLRRPGHTLGMKLYSDLQSLEGDVTASDEGGVVVEWPDSDWLHFGVAFFWRGEF